MELKTHILKNRSGFTVEATNFGGIITRIMAHDRDGNFDDVVLGFDEPSQYQQNPYHPYFGALIGRFGNRISQGSFVLDGKQYSLTRNLGAHHLHGGVLGFDKVFWETREDENKLFLEYKSSDGEEGYPGNLNVKVIYEVSEQNELKIFYEAVTDKTTPVNLTQHSYFNLSGGRQRTILDHELTIIADEITEVNSELIPTGNLIPVKDTMMDFTHRRKIEFDIYDHNWVLRCGTAKLKLAALLYEPHSGRVMEVHTTEPGLQFYGGGFLDGTLTGKNGIKYEKNAGLCLETQHFPDSPNHPNFPDTFLRPGNKYTSTTIYKFGVE